MEYQFCEYELRFLSPFKLAHGTREGTKALFLKITKNGVSGYGEATFPPYLNETCEQTKKSLSAFLNSYSTVDFDSLNEITHSLCEFNFSPFTRALLLNCLADYNARRFEMSMTEFCYLKNDGNYKSTITLTKNSIRDFDIKTIEKFNLLKLKLDGNNDLHFVREVVQKFNLRFCIDVNQGWEKFSNEECDGLFNELKSFGALFIEQPFHFENHQRHFEFKSKNILPVFADESIWSFDDLKNNYNCYSGINIKLLKCGGIDNGIKMAEFAKTKNLKIIVGCMSESSCGCATSFALNSFADYLDLDGPWLINNNPFEGLEISHGKFSLKSEFGIGVDSKNNTLNFTD